MQFLYLTSGKQFQYFSPGGYLPFVWAYTVYGMFKWFVFSQETIDRHGTDHICPLQEFLRLHERPGDVRIHELCTIQQRQSFFGSKRDGFQPFFFQGLCSRHFFAFIAHFTFPEEWQAQMGQRCQVARGAKGAQLINYRGYAQIVKICKALHDLCSHTAIALAQAVYLQQQHKAHYFFRHFVAHTAGV